MLEGAHVTSKKNKKKKKKKKKERGAHVLKFPIAIFFGL